MGIIRYTTFSKDTDCYSCKGCHRCNDPKFVGVPLCHSYWPEVVSNKFIDDIIKNFMKERRGGTDEKD